MMSMYTIEGEEKQNLENEHADKERFEQLGSLENKHQLEKEKKTTYMVGLFDH